MPRKATAAKPRPKAAAPPRGAAAEVLRPAAAPPEPSQGVRFVYVPMTQAGVRVDEDSALKLGPVWACVRYISESLAALPWRVLRRLPGGGKAEAPDHGVDWLIHTQPNEEMSAMTFREVMLAWALTYGNGYAEIERDGAGRPWHLWPITPNRVNPARTGRGELVYDVWNPAGPNTVLGPADVYHVKGLSFEGLLGYNLARLAAESFGLGLAAEKFAASFFGNDSTPGGVLEMDGSIKDPEAVARLQRDWESRHRGPKGARRIAVLENGLKFRPVATEPEKGQMVPAMQHAVEAVARWYRVPPHKIGHLLRSTYNNVEHQSLEAVVDCLLPWARRLESEADLKLFGRQQRGVYYTKVNLNGLLRGDAASRGNFYKTMASLGVFSINDILEMEDRNPIGPDGDKRLVPANLTTLEKVGADPPPPAPPARDGPGGARDGPGPAQDAPGSPPARRGPAPAALRPVFLDAARRVVRREAHRVRDAAKRLGGRPDELAAWLAEFLPGHAAYAREQMTPPALALAGGADATGGAGVAVAVAADAHAADLRARCEAGYAAGTLAADCDGWEAAAAGPLADRAAAQVAAAVAAAGAAGDSPPAPAMPPAAAAPQVITLQPQITLQSSPVALTVPERPPPVVNVTVERPEPAVVTVTNELKAPDPPPAKARRTRVTYDDRGRVAEKVEEDVPQALYSPGRPRNEDGESADAPEPGGGGGVVY